MTTGTPKRIRSTAPIKRALTAMTNGQVKAPIKRALAAMTDGQAEAAQKGAEVSAANEKRKEPFRRAIATLFAKDEAAKAALAELKNHRADLTLKPRRNLLEEPRPVIRPVLDSSLEIPVWTTPHDIQVFVPPYSPPDGIKWTWGGVKESDSQPSTGEMVQSMQVELCREAATGWSILLRTDPLGPAQSRIFVVRAAISFDFECAVGVYGYGHANIRGGVDASVWSITDHRFAAPVRRFHAFSKEMSSGVFPEFGEERQEGGGNAASDEVELTFGESKASEYLINYGVWSQAASSGLAATGAAASIHAQVRLVAVHSQVITTKAI